MERIAKDHHLRQVCLYCKRAQEGRWKPEFHLEHQYKVKLCGCGKKLHVKMKYITDGNDRWSLDDRVMQHGKR
ncbi:MAG TPA: hypothetical protein VJC16_03015 [Candidatus Nanoarchaeia archaeon]|nr:hypothetical protein [Candidatus Nanoarchaeia archaeon]